MIRFLVIPDFDTNPYTKIDIKEGGNNGENNIKSRTYMDEYFERKT